MQPADGPNEKAGLELSRQRYALQVSVQLADGVDGRKLVWETPKKDPRDLGGDSYLERLLQSAAACCPLGLHIAPSNGSQGGFLLVRICWLLIQNPRS